jgi:hypothetical protein
MHNTLRTHRQPPATEKSAADATTTDDPSPSTSVAPQSALHGWKYRNPQIGRGTLPCYASPFSQLIIVSFVCFLCPGMFNALSGMGGGGQVDATANDEANTALYSTFAVVGFFAGTITNKLGIKAALSFGGLGWVLLEPE